MHVHDCVNMCMHLQAVTCEYKAGLQCKEAVAINVV